MQNFVFLVVAFLCVVVHVDATRPNCPLSNTNGEGVLTITTCLSYNESDSATTCHGGYRILGRSQNAVFIGGRNEIVAVKLTDSDEFTSETVGTCYSNSIVACLRITSTSKNDDCVNYIRSVLPLDGRLYVCGSNALLPRCFFCDYTESTMELHCDFTGNDEEATDTSCLSTYEDATNIFPSLGTVNASSYLSDSNSKLYVGVATDPRTKTKVEIASIGLNADGAFENDRVTTRVNNEREVFDADFVGSPIERNGRTYFIFRETAAEYADQVQDQNIGSVIYSRIARVCSNDVGVLVGTAQVWTSYQKIRLECAEESPAINGSSVTYFNEIQDFEYVETEGIIYAIFTNERNAPARSAVCKYDLAYIDDIFDNADFFGPDTSGTNPRWAVPAVPDPRPGLDCGNPSSNADFTRDYPLMKTFAKHNETKRNATDIKSPFLVLDDRRFSSLDISSGWYYIATDSGSIIKFNGNTPEEFSVVPGEAIKDIMKTDEDGEYFVITTMHHVKRVDLRAHAKSGNYKFPAEDTIIAKPNSVVSITYYSMSTTGPQHESFLLSEETLSDEECNVIRRVNIRVLGNMTVDFGSCYINPTTILTYHNYTQDECDNRGLDWKNMKQKISDINQAIDDGTCSVRDPSNTCAEI